MATAEQTREINRIRKELAEVGADPFRIAAEVLVRNDQLLREIERLEAMLRR